MRLMTTSTPRKKSLLTQAGDAAKLDAERKLLRRTLRAHGWNLTHTAAALEMGSPTAVLHAIDRYDLRAEYERHRAAS
jgi:transcriptional regulator with GAF, ATPase, and Fis domain